VNGAPTGPQGARRNTPSYNAQDQLMFEQQKYEQQQSRRGGGQANPGFQQGGPTSWEGMYDDVPQPNVGGGGRGGKGQQRSSLQLRLPMLRLGPKMLACLGQTTVAEEVDIVGAFTHTLGDEISHSSSVA